MVAGLPGFGLSGVFFLISALLMVPIELVATLRGRSSLARWGAVLRSAGIALAIVGGLELTYAVLHLAVTQLSGPAATGAHGSVEGAPGSSAPPASRPVDVVHAMPVAPILGTLGLVAIVILAGKAAELLSDLRGRRRTRSVARPATALAELRSLEERRREHVVEHERLVEELKRPRRVASGQPR